MTNDKRDKLRLLTDVVLFKALRAAHDRIIVAYEPEFSSIDLPHLETFCILAKEWKRRVNIKTPKL